MLCYTCQQRSIKAESICLKLAWKCVRFSAKAIPSIVTSFGFSYVVGVWRCCSIWCNRRLMDTMSAYLLMDKPVRERLSLFSALIVILGSPLELLVSFLESLNGIAPNIPFHWRLVTSSCLPQTLYISRGRKWAGLVRFRLVLGCISFWWLILLVEKLGQGSVGFLVQPMSQFLAQLCLPFLSRTVNIYLLPLS